jgi:hypothetical protein
LSLHAVWAALASAVLLFNVAAARADSNIATPAAGFQAADEFDGIVPNWHDVRGDYVAIYADQQLRVFDRNTEALLFNLGASPMSGTTYNSFVTFDPSGESIWVGFTVGGNVNDRIYQFSLADSSWTHKATLVGNFDLAFAGGVPYVTATGSTNWSDPACIWQLDLSGAGSHRKVAQLDGFSAGLAADAAGNLYYATNIGASDRLVRFAADSLAGSTLGLGDGEVLSSLPASYYGYDVNVDAAGNVLVSLNSIDANWNALGSSLAVWNGTPGSGLSLQEIASAGAGTVFTNVSTFGNVLAGGAAYVADGGWGAPNPGLAKIQAVPEPSAYVLLAISLIALVGYCRR